MLSKRYESTQVDPRTWLHVPSGGGLRGPQSNVTCYDISLIYVTLHTFAGGLKKFDLRSDSYAIDIL